MRAFGVILIGVGLGWILLGLMNCLSVSSRMLEPGNSFHGSILFIGHIFLYWLLGIVVASLGFIVRCLSIKKESR